MHTTRLKRVGGSVMLTVPPALLNALSLGTDNEVGMVIDNGRLIVEPYTYRKLKNQSIPLSTPYAT